MAGEEPRESAGVGGVRIAYLVKQLELALRARLDALSRQFGLTTAQYVALTVLRTSPGLSSAQLARRSFVSAQTMQEMIATLERGGWIEREPDPANRRVLRARLTRRGRDVLDDSDAGFDAIEAEMLAGLDDAEIVLLRRSLRSCVTNLRRELPG